MATPQPMATVMPRQQATRSTPLPSPTPRPSPAAHVASPVSYASQAETINALLAPEAGVYGVVVATPQGKVLYSRNADLPFISASLYKLVLMADVYNQEAQGELSFDEELVLQRSYFSEVSSDEPDSVYSTPDIGTSVSIQQALFATVAYSSNVAARALIDRVGSDSINAMASDLGLEHTFFLASCDDLPNWPPEAGPGDEQSAVTLATREIEQWCTEDQTVNITTPNDITKFLTMVYQGEVISQQASQGMLELLKQQAVDNKFPVLLPSGTTLAHKTGDLDGTVHHDVGIIYTPSGPVILTAMSTAAPDDDHDWQVIQRLAFIVYGNNYWPPFTEQAVPDEGNATAAAETPGAGATSVESETPVTDEPTEVSSDEGETPESGP